MPGKSSAASAGADGLDGRNRKLGGLLFGLILALMLIAIVTVLTH